MPIQRIAVSSLVVGAAIASLVLTSLSPIIVSTLSLAELFRHGRNTRCSGARRRFVPFPSSSCSLTMRSSGSRGEALVLPVLASARGRLTRC